jgi:hypothetical protein
MAVIPLFPQIMPKQYQLSRWYLADREIALFADALFRFGIVLVWSAQKGIRA